MFTRFTTVFSLGLMCAALFACGDSVDEAATAGAGVTGPAPTLTIVGADAIEVAPRGAAEIRVRYRDRDFDGDGEGDLLAGVSIEFALVGDAAAVSLSPSQAVTDAYGEAVARLTAGSDSARFRVRASAEGAEPVYVDVEVEESAVREVQISARYEGLRNLTTRKVTALAGLGCDVASALLAADGSSYGSESYDDPEGSVSFPLGPGLHYALVAWGTDARGGILAEGCSETDVPVDVELPFDGIVIELLDRPLSLAGSYEVTLELDVARSAQRAGETALLGGQTLLSTGITADADYFLDAIEAGMRAAGKGTDADALLAARSDGVLATSLQTELNADNVGARPWLSQLSATIQDRGSRLGLKATYGVTSIAGVPMSLTLTGMQSRSADGTRSLSYPTMLLPMMLIDAQYDDARAVIAVDTIRIQLPLGTYAARLLDAIDAAEAQGLLGLLSAYAGCEQLVDWSAGKAIVSGACDDNCVRAACNGAIAALLSKARMRFSTLDPDHPSIGVRGELSVFDGDNDSIVDALSTAAFEGSWGKAPKADQADAVDADFSVVTTIPAL